MDICKCIVISRNEVTLNSRRAASPLVRLVEEQERWRTSYYPQGVILQNWGATKQNRSVTFIALKAKANDRCKNLVLSCDNFVGFDLILLSMAA
ncbi:uncharacterized protein TNCV_3443451 [Trichonephila clavipes]|nr:uncharacterized protein TNCV_3443451 [Trichonephila clavipes]